MRSKKVQMNIRVSEEARKLITENAKYAEQTQSEFIETIARRGLYQVIEFTQPDLVNNWVTIMNALDKCGRNLNQITTKINSGATRFTDDDIKMIKEFEKLMDKLYNALHKEYEKKTIFTNKDGEE
ncbi:hypothetical protein P3799_26980 [Pseudomonas aeruginosa]|uniref:plasmid mobilization protein n=1 Tax=Pseudomonas aeruginosa TaxID=287 RepID=UPI001F227071|nr:hypothetical protein [Pseudomonas aeruginosa]MDP5420891.1 hypothetical protein [Pseudomonas aeruginosa]UJC26757.1 hypothetical protein HUK75_29735 [Pseudomonas aeruginosa]HCF1796922.1 hypothetical protein [Pseudomonas aeruginosa]